MRIVVNDIAASEGGALSVLKDLYEKILLTDDENEWIFLLSDDFIAPSEKIKIIKYPKIKKSWLKRISFDFFYGKKIVNNLNPDLYVSLQNTATLGVKAKQLVYFHQVIPFQTNYKFSFFKNMEIKLWIYQNIGKIIYSTLFRYSNAKIIVQSEWMKTSMKKTIKNDFIVSRPEVSTEITNYKFDPKKFLKNRIFFFPTTNYVYKNFDVVIKAVKILNDLNIFDFEVVLTLPQENFSEVKNVRCINEIPRREVYDMMSKSVLLFPSKIESFGLPLLEATEINCPIIAADLEYARETTMEYRNIDFFKPDDSQGLARIMQEKLLSVDFQRTPVKSTKFKKYDLLNIILGEKNE